VRRSLVLYLLYLIYFLYFISTMRRILIGGLALLLGGVISARPKAPPLVFVFLRVDSTRDLAILRPMIAPDIGVQLDSGPRKLDPGTALRCEATAREHSAIVEGQLGKVTDLVLDCVDRKFVVKTVEFSPQGRTSASRSSPYSRESLSVQPTLR
jgi:hypothetical protein